jgi:hypothetical protein
MHSTGFSHSVVEPTIPLGALELQYDNRHSGADAMNEAETTSRATRRGGIKERIASDGKERIETSKRRAADQIAEIADAIDAAGSQLDASQPTLAGYASRLAEGIGSFSTRLRDESIEELYRDACQLASRNPAIFLIGGAALGFVAARFMKASEAEAYAQESSEWDTAGSELGVVSRPTTADSIEDDLGYRTTPGPTTTSYSPPLSGG